VKGRRLRDVGGGAEREHKGLSVEMKNCNNLFANFFSSAPLSSFAFPPKASLFRRVSRKMLRWVGDGREKQTTRRE
jgi:hypothetical protein